MSRRFFQTLVFIAVFNLYSVRIQAESELEGKFQDMFVTAGYSAAAGAAIGAALLTFQDEPTKHLKFISVGASIGFLSGTVLGSWLSVAPVFLADENDTKAYRTSSHYQSDAHQRIVVRPWIDLKRQNVSGIEAGAIFASF